MHKQDPSLLFPMLVWDTFPKSGASQVIFFKIKSKPGNFFYNFDILEQSGIQNDVQPTPYAAATRAARECSVLYVLVVRFLVLPVCNNSSYSNNTMTHTRVKSSNAKLVLLPLAAAELESLMIMVQQPLQCFGVLIDRILSWVAHPELGSKKEKTKREIILLLGK